MGIGLGPLAAVAQGDTLLNAAQADTTEANRLRQPVFTLTTDDLDGELGNQDISGILQSSRDVFTAVAGFNFGQARFRIRGYDSENTLVTINGVMVNDLETGWATWSNWAGLNDVTRWMQVRTGITSNRSIFGSIGGHTDMNIQPSGLRKGVRVSYASTNRAYRNRLMFTYNTGMNAKGWAFSVSGSRRWAEEGYVEGTSFNAFAYYLAAEKRINEQHTISFSGFGAPIIQGRQGIAVQEAYDLTDNPWYNPNWGYQNGVKRNAKMSHDHKPMLMATHTFHVSDAAKLTSSIYYTFGRDGLTGLNWFDAKDPRPDYYRYLPSYYQFENAHLYDDRVAAWENTSTSQIDWDQLFFANGKNLYSVQNANGVTGNTITGNRSKYIVEEVRADPMRFGFNTAWTKALSETTQLTIGGSMHKQRTHYFKVVDDLLGGDFWVDIDQFADRDFSDTTISQNDLSTPNKVVEEGDVFGWDYYIHTRYINTFAQLERTWGRLETYAGIDLSSTSFWRDGKLQNGRFPDNSLGTSEKQDFFGLGLKAGATYKLTGRHFVSGNAAYITRPPASNVSYLSPRIRDEVIPGLTEESVISGDISYILRAPRLKVRATLYYTRLADQVWNRSYYHEEYLTLVNYSMTGVDQVHQGFELGAEANLTSTWVATAVYAGGTYTYDSRPTATLTRNNSTEQFGDRVIYWKGYRVGGMPQSAASMGLKYNSPKFWFAGFNANWFGRIYLDPNPDRRTEEAVQNLVTSDPQWDELLDQTRLDDQMTVDLYAGKSWMFQRKYRLAVNLSVTNVLDNQEFRTGGFEQLRYDRMTPNRFPPKYSYLFGRNYFAMVTFSF